MDGIERGESEDEIKKLLIKEGMMANAANPEALILKSRVQRGFVALVTVAALLLLLAATGR